MDQLWQKLSAARSHYPLAGKVWQKERKKRKEKIHLSLCVCFPAWSLLSDWALSAARLRWLAVNLLLGCQGPWDRFAVNWLVDRDRPKDRTSFPAEHSETQFLHPLLSSLTFQLIQGECQPHTVKWASIWFPDLSCSVWLEANRSTKAPPKRGVRALRGSVYVWSLFFLIFTYSSVSSTCALSVNTHTHGTRAHTRETNHSSPAWCADPGVAVRGQGHAAAFLYSHNPLWWLGERAANG